jgi:hypothetical protein
MSVQNQKPALDDVRPVIDENIVNTVHEIFEEVTKLNALQDCFEDLANLLIEDLAANSLLDYNLELKDEQKEQLRRALQNKGNDTVRNYLANIDTNERSKAIYGICREKTTSIVDTVLASIGQEINRGAIINAIAVQANSKSEDYDEILLRKGKNSGDITIPTHCILISTNCVAMIKSSCQEEKIIEDEDGETGEGEESVKKEKAAADKPAKPRKGKK